jgi:glycosyltransferase involved in cell wall biosynthesis
MNILMVSARYLPFLGGVETHIDAVGQRLAAWGHNISVLTTDTTGALPIREERGGLSIHRVKAWPKNRDYHFAPSIYREIAQRRKDYDIIHFQGYNAFVPIIGMMGAIRCDIPFVLTFHSGGHPSRLRNSIRGLQQKSLSPLVSHAAQLIGVSEFEADLMATNMRLDRRRFVVIRNGASLPSPDPDPVTDPYQIMSIGRLERYKGHHRAIEALGHLLYRVPDARLKIVGSGPYEPDLRRLVRWLNLDEYVSFVSIPPAERQRFSNLLHTAGLVVLLSEYEANPLAVMEALAARRRVLVSNTSGLRELADEGWCRSIPIETTPVGVAEAMATELMDRQQTAPFAVPTWDDCARQLLGVYEAVRRGRTVGNTVEALS